METLLCKLRLGVTDTPGIPVAEVRAALWNQIDKRSKLQGGSVERRTIEEIFHTIRHRLLHRICLAQLVQALAPSVNLRTRAHLGRTYIVARQAQGTCRYVIAVLLRILQHTQVHTYRTRNEIGVTVTTRTAINRTGVHAGSAAHALQGLPVVLVGENIASAVIHQNHMHLGTRTSLTEMRSIGSGRLTGSTAAEQALEYSQ